ncbi:MAG: peptidoglycan-binding protein [Verrucomicrobiota bacterium]|nr:peptidoglycan-binding protein [Verrucomicrobiota bacterium]
MEPRRPYLFFMHGKRCLIFIAILSSLAAPALVSASPLFGSGDPLAQRDEWGALHQSKWIDEPDYAKREWWRLFYYNKSRYVLMQDQAYVGALQVALQRNGYYCGPIDGVYSPEVSEAIAHLQKNYRMRVTGNLSVPVRRALRLP